MVAEFGIAIVPISIYFRDRVYRDWIDITPSQAYKLFLEDPESFATSPASPAEYLEAYQRAAEQATKVLCITLSSKLSTGYNVASVAREQARALLPGLNIEVMDSRMVTAAQGFIVLAAARASATGASLSEVVQAAERVRGRVNFLILVDTLRHVYRTGRIPKIAARVGSMLRIRPILSMRDGAVRFSGAVRTRENGIERILALLASAVGREPVHVGVMHAYAPEEAERLKERLAAEFNCVELWLSEFSPVMGYATGTGSLGFAFYCDD